MRRHASVLNREIRYERRKGITIEADPRYAKLIVQEAGCEHMGILKIPAARPNDKERDEAKKGDANEEPPKITITRLQLISEWAVFVPEVIEVLVGNATPNFNFPIQRRAEKFQNPFRSKC